MEVIHNIDKNAANAFLYGIDNQNIDYFRNKYDILKETLVHNSPYIEQYTGFLNNIEYLSSDGYITDVKRSLVDNNLTGRDDYNLYYYSNPTEANDITRRYIMADPYMQSLYNRGLIEGYSDSYIHNESEAKDLYVSVMDGVLNDKDECITYYGYDKIELSNEDKNIVMLNWETCKHLLREDIDPTAT